MKVRSLREARELSKKRILVRIDANVPLKGNKILDDFKIRQSLATIDYLLKKNAQIFLVSHLGCPSVAVSVLDSWRPLLLHLAPADDLLGGSENLRRGLYRHWGAAEHIREEFSRRSV
jgi:3-phosphoglycerate kinase